MPVRVFRVNPSASRRHYKLCLRCVAGARGVSECGRKGLSPSSRGGRSRRAAAEYQPGYDGLPGGGGRRSQPCESRGEWRAIRVGDAS